MRANDLTVLSCSLLLIMYWTNDSFSSLKVTCLDVTIDGLGLVSGSADGTIRLWNIQSKQCIRSSALKGLMRCSCVKNRVTDSFLLSLKKQITSDQSRS